MNFLRCEHGEGGSNLLNRGRAPWRGRAGTGAELAGVQVVFTGGGV